MADTIRPVVDDVHDVQERVAEYADENGLTMSRAWATLVDRGLLDAEDSDIEHTSEYADALAGEHDASDPDLDETEEQILNSRGGE